MLNGEKYFIALYLSLLFFELKGQYIVSALSVAPTKPLFAELQRCFAPNKILHKVGRHVHPDLDPNGILSSLILVRLSKQLITLSNSDEDFKLDDDDNKYLSKILKTFAIASWSSSAQSRDSAVEGTKAASVISRLLPDLTNDETWEPLLQQWHEQADGIARYLEPYQLSGLKWSLDCFNLRDNIDDYILPPSIQRAYDSLQLPFLIRPALCQKIPAFTVSNLTEQVHFQFDTVRTKSNRVVKERRQTAWEGDDNVAPFDYSGKSMERRPWSPLVLEARNHLSRETGHKYDGCLLNLYPDGGSGMRYHSDPDQGKIWSYETVVVSAGATRRFAFRNIPTNDRNHDIKPHVFVLFHGDVTEMFNDCQAQFQHTVKTAEGKNESMPRASLVFKKTLIP